MVGQIISHFKFIEKIGKVAMDEVVGDRSLFGGLQLGPSPRVRAIQLGKHPFPYPEN